MKERGLTLLEILVSMSVLAFGLLALLSLNITSFKTNALGSDIPTALALAQDFVNQVKTWDVTADTRLTDTNPGNNDALFDFDPDNPSAEHNESELTTANYNGIVPCDTPYLGILCSLDGNTPFFQRYWNIADVEVGDGDPAPDVKVIVVHVLFTTSSGYRTFVSLVASLSM